MMNPVRDIEWEFYPNIEPGMKMLELGDKINRGVTYKQYFESLGVNHTSIDWNGKNGAINRDLRTPLWHEFGQFDVVTNIGTTEHVDDQKMVWSNISEMCKVGGYVVCVTPAPIGDNWWWHGEYYPTIEFYHKFAEVRGYKILKIREDHPKPHRNIYCLLHKTSIASGEIPIELIHKNTIRPRYA